MTVGEVIAALTLYASKNITDLMSLSIFDITINDYGNSIHISFVDGSKDDLDIDCKGYSRYESLYESGEGD